MERFVDIMQSVFYRVSQIDDALRISVHIVSEVDLRGFMSERPELKVQQEEMCIRDSNSGIQCEG